MPLAFTQTAHGSVNIICEIGKIVLYQELFWKFPQIIWSRKQLCYNCINYILLDIFPLISVTFCLISKNDECSLRSLLITLSLECGKHSSCVGFHMQIRFMLACECRLYPNARVFLIPFTAVPHVTEKW